jgi:hypothetical protein
VGTPARPASPRAVRVRHRERRAGHRIACLKRRTGRCVGELNKLNQPDHGPIHKINPGSEGFPRFVVNKPYM